LTVKAEIGRQTPFASIAGKAISTGSPYRLAATLGVSPGQSPIVILPLQPGNKFDKRGTIPPDGKTEDTLMYTVVRSYFGKGAKELFDVLEKNKADVEKTLRSVKGLVSYTLVRSADGGFSVTVCNDKAGTDESLEKAKDWIARNAAGTGVAAPKVSEGSVVFDLK
jgi:hypothetical protein